MTKSQLHELINTSSQDVLSRSKDTLHDELKAYADENGKVSTESLAALCVVTSYKLANQMLFEVLSKALTIEE